MQQLLVQLLDRTYPCEVKHSKRARYLRVKLTNTGALSVVVPSRVGMSQIEAFLASQSDWIERNLKGLSPINHKPNALHLVYLDEIWNISYSSNQQLASVLVRPLDSFGVECLGDVDNTVLLHKGLGKWLKHKAEQVIPARLSVLSELHGFHFNRVTIRGQKTRWGSCSSSKNINLNYKLLFLEPELVDYVLIHEL